MSLVSNTFLLFILAAAVLYYLVPLRFRWIILLAASFLYYAAGGVKFLFFISYSIVIIYGCALWIRRLQEAGASAGKQKAALILGLVLNLGMLGVVKYTNFVTGTLNGLFSLQIPEIAILFPLGISFYTFQSSGYLLDVYWKRVEPEKNFLKFALFVSFFPQLMQGPIGKFDRLAPQLTEGHPLDLRKVAHGLERMAWGFAKKMILADWAGVFADAIWGDLNRYRGLALFGLLFYGIQLYADFSGAMDVVIGIAELFGVNLDENFRQPYLAVSLADFWRRWHITLGRWMKDYVFYPVSLSGWMKKLTKWAKTHLGKKIGRTLPIAVADILVFLLVGIWHGASWKFVVYGLINGFILAFSELMSGVYASWKKGLHISGKEAWFHLFQILRTFTIVSFTWLYDRSDSLEQGNQMLKLCFTHFNPARLLDISAGSQGRAFAPWALLIIAVGCVVMVGVGILRERGVKIRERLNALPLPATVAVFLLLFIMIGLFGCTAAPKGFIYAQF